MLLEKLQESEIQSTYTNRLIFLRNYIFFEFSTVMCLTVLIFS